MGIQQTIFMKLNLGCERDIRKGFINVDIRKFKGVDVIHDLNKFPYPFGSSSITYIHSRNCFEQLDDMDKVTDELYRICDDEAIIDLEVFHFSSVMAFNSTHKTFFNINSMRHFKSKFDVLRNDIIISDNKTFLIRIIERLINRHKEFYEKSFFKMLDTSLSD